MSDDVDLAAIIEGLRGQYGPKTEFVSVETSRARLIFRSPTSAEHRRFLSELRDDDLKAVATHNLVLVVCAYPARAEVAALLERFPGLIAHMKVQNAITWLTGQADTLLGKAFPAP